MRKAPRRGLRLAKFQFLLFLLVCFLLPDVIADDLFRHTDGADAVPACPQVVAREVALPSCALGFSWTLDCERVLAGGVSR